MISLQVYDNNVVLGTIEVNDSDTFPLALSKSNADVRDITKRRGVFSKNFKILATTQNNRVLNYIYNANATAQVYRNCILSYNNTEILRGKVQVLNVAQTKQGEEYNLVIYSDNVDWYFLLNGKTIQNLNYGNNTIPSFIMTNGQPSGIIPQGNTSTLDRAYIEASWRNKDKFDYVYNLVSYGQPINGTTVSEQDLRPSIYLGKMLKKAFTSVGYTLISDFFDTGIGASLILQYVGNGFTQSVEGSFNIKALGSQNIGTIVLPPQAITYVRLIPNQVIDDPSASYDTSTGVITLATDGEYSYDLNVSINIKSPTFITVPPNGGANIVLRDIATQTQYVTASYTSATSGAFQQPFTQTFTWLTQTTPQQIPAGSYELVLELRTIGSGTMDFTLLDGSTFIQSFQENITQGQTYSVSSVLPQFKILDIIGGMQNMFNLYFETDNERNTITIEPKPVMLKPFSEGVDLSGSINVENQISTEFISSYNRLLRFNFKNDSNDKYQDAYNIQNGTLFGSIQYDLGSDFKEGFTDTGTNYFAATLVYDKHPFCPANNRCPIPVLWSENALSPPQTFAFEPRILYYKGYGTIGLDNGNLAIWSWLGTPLADIPSSFMVDPDFRVSNPINIVYTDKDNANGLARTYYNSDIAVIIDRRIHKGFFRLTATGFYGLDLYKPIYLDMANFRGWYYINQVIDFMPNKETTTLYELVRAYSGILINNPESVEIPVVQDPIRKAGSIGGGTQTSGKAASNETTTLNNGSGNVGWVRGGGVIWGNGGVQGAIDQHVYGNYNSPNTSIWVVGAGTLTDRYNGLQFTRDGRILQHGGEVRARIGGVLQRVETEMEVDGLLEFSSVYLTGNR